MARKLLAVVVLMGLCLTVAQAYFSQSATIEGKTKEFAGWNTDIDTATAETITDNGSYSFPTSAFQLTVASTNGNDAGGVYATGTLTVVDYAQMLGTKATGTFTVNTNALASLNGITLTVNGISFIAGTNFNINGGQSTADIASNIATVINANGNLAAKLTATSSSNVVTLTADANGETANSYALVANNGSVASINGITASASTMLGGEDLLTLTVNGINFVAGVAFTPTTSNADTASAIVTALNANGNLAAKLTASSSGRVITLTADTIGTAGNSLATSSNDSDSLTAAAATLTGGRAAKTGARTLTITGLNGGYAEISETLTLNGTTAQTTTNSYLRVNAVEVATAGTNNSNIGNITVKSNGTTLSKVLAGNNKAFQGVYTVPSGKTIFVTDLNSNVTGAPVRAELQVKPVDGVFSTKYTLTPDTDGGASVSSVLLSPIAIPPRSDIQLKGTATSNNGNVFYGVRFIEQ